MAVSENRSLVETAWLADHMDAPDVIILDASWHLPTSGRSGRAEYAEAHIPGAVFLDIDELSDEKSNLPHMLPDTVKFASFMKKIGVGDGVHVIVYDADGIFSAARVWWMLRVMGHNEVSVLNGGLRKWRAEDRPVTDDEPDHRPRVHFTPRMQAALVADRDDVSTLSQGNAGDSGKLVDARPADRFTGDAPEPRPGLNAGHIPGSINIPYGSVLNADGTMKSADELTKLFKAAKIEPNTPVTTTCGSGVTAAIVALALAQVGNDSVAVYDGSWAEWGDPENGFPFATGHESEG